MGDDEVFNPEANPTASVPDRHDDDGNNLGISLKQARDAIMEHGEKKRELTSGAIDMAGDRVSSLLDDTLSATEPMAEVWREQMGHKYPHLAGKSTQEAYNIDENFRRDYDVADEEMRILQEGTRRGLARLEHEKLKRLRPQAYTKQGTPESQSRADAVEYLIEQKGMTKQEADLAFNQGALGKASEQAKLFDQSNAWARDRRELKSLNAKANLNNSMTLREAIRRQTLKRRLGK